MTPKEVAKKMGLLNVIWATIAVAGVVKGGTYWGFIPLCISLAATVALMWVAKKRCDDNNPPGPTER